MKSAFTLSVLVSGVLAAAAPFQLVISGSQSRTNELKDRALVSQGDAFIVAPKGEHGINFTGGDGTLGLQNGDVGEFFLRLDHISFFHTRSSLTIESQSTLVLTATSTSRAPTALLLVV